ncbi:MAG: histidine kinase [Halanaeroarchaeum sp.]
MTLGSFIDAVEARTDRTYTLALVNDDRPEPVTRMVARLFDDQPVAVDERRLEGFEENVVVLFADGDVVATSPLDDLEREILFVNSDLYKTGEGHFESLETPAVLTELEDVAFRLRGYPESDTEKLLLIALSRYVERLAWTHGTGRLRSAFQRLSRIRDERGTGAVYRRLGGTDVDVHLYGRPDWIPPAEYDAVVHAGRSPLFRDFWFVLARPEGRGTAGALLAEELAPAPGVASGRSTKRGSPTSRRQSSDASNQR